MIISYVVYSLRTTEPLDMDGTLYSMTYELMEF